MKRHPALAPLSRDHHHALVLAQRLRRATTQTARDIAGAFLAHWNAEQKLHFRLEEQLLLPAYAAYGQPDHPAIIRMLLDHMLIRRDAAALTAAPPLELLHELGARLADHVRRLRLCSIHGRSQRTGAVSGCSAASAQTPASERVRERSRVSDAHRRSPQSRAVANAGTCLARMRQCGRRSSAPVSWTPTTSKHARAESSSVLRASETAGPPSKAATITRTRSCMLMVQRAVNSAPRDARRATSSSARTPSASASRHQC